MSTYDLLLFTLLYLINLLILLKEPSREKALLAMHDDKQADVIDAFNTTSRYLDDILNINNVYFDNIVSQIYPLELQLNKHMPLIPKPHF